MGIYFKVCIRFLCVSDTSKVSLDILQADPYDTKKTDADNAALWKEKLKPYYETLKTNVKRVVHCYKHEGKNYHSLLNVQVPDWYEQTVEKKSNVIAFSNWADGPYNMSTCYTTTFYDRYGQVLDTITKIPSCEVNRFMLLLPENTHYIRYSIFESAENRNYQEDHFFNFTYICATCEDNDDAISLASEFTCGENDENTDTDDDDSVNDDDNNDDTGAEVESIEEDASEMGLYDSESRFDFEFNSESL